MSRTSGIEDDVTEIHEIHHRNSTPTSSWHFDVAAGAVHPIATYHVIHELICMAKRLTVNPTHRALANFCLWFEHIFPAIMHNSLTLKKAAKPDLNNAVLLFAFPRAVDGVVERMMLELEQAWAMTNAELGRHQLRQLGQSAKDYRHIKRIRNKLVAHRIENAVRAPQHRKWYANTYGSYEAVFKLAERVGTRVSQKISLLERRGLLQVRSAAGRAVRKFTIEDVDALYTALRAHGIY